MKNVQVIDGAQNSEYAIFAFEDAQFDLIFPGQGQDIEFIDDVVARLSGEQIERAFKGVWARKIPKAEVSGIHGTLFYELEFKKKFYPGKMERKLLQ